MEKQKKLTTCYFNDRSKEWAESVYNSDNRFDRFPTSLVRDGIIYADLGERKDVTRVKDFGCGSGEMVLELFRKGYEATGVDIAENMISLAQEGLKKEYPEKKPEEVFVLGDAESYKEEALNDAAIATGVIEYLEEDLPLLQAMSDSVKKDGLVYVACRNQLFNATTANKFTLEEKEKGELERLITEFEDVEKYSPVKFDDSMSLQNDMLLKIRDLVSEDEGKFVEKAAEDVLEFPSEMVRRFHSPADMEKLGKEVGLELERVEYFHFHPFPPKFAEAYPSLYNGIALAMQSLGKTSVGAHMGSGFVAIYKKV